MYIQNNNSIYPIKMTAANKQTKKYIITKPQPIKCFIPLKTLVSLQQHTKCTTEIATLIATLKGKWRRSTANICVKKHVHNESTERNEHIRTFSSNPKEIDYNENKNIRFLFCFYIFNIINCLCNLNQFNIISQNKNVCTTDTVNIIFSYLLCNPINRLYIFKGKYANEKQMKKNRTHILNWMNKSEAGYGLN